MPDKNPERASGLFNRLIGSILNKSKEPNLAYKVYDADAQILVENFLSSDISRITINGLGNIIERKRAGKTKTLGFVTKVEEREDGPVPGCQQIEYFSTNGLMMGFLFEPDGSRFPNAPTGFKPGEIILNTQIASHSMAMDKVEILNDLPPKTQEKILRRFQQIAAEVERNT